MSTQEIVIFFGPIALYLIAAISIFVLLVTKVVSKVVTTISIVIWVLVSLVMLMFAVSYLIGPDCVFCYEPKHTQLAFEFLIAVVIFAVGGGVLVVWSRRTMLRKP